MLEPIINVSILASYFRAQAFLIYKDKKHTAKQKLPRFTRKVLSILLETQNAFRN